MSKQSSSQGGARQGSNGHGGSGSRSSTSSKGGSGRK